jgi:Protein of unknown function (DUF4232)
VAHRERIGIVATLVALTLAGCESTIVHSKPTATMVLSPTPSLVTRGCLASDFKVGTGASGAYQGDAVWSMALRNVSGIACTLNEAPRMTLTLQSGAQEPVTLGDASIYEAVDVGPGQILHIMVGSPGNCANPSTSPPASSLTVDLPGGRVIDNGVNLYVRCGAPSVLIFTPVDPPASTG